MTFMHTRAERKELPGGQPARGAVARFGGPYLCTHACKIYKMQQGCRICGSPVLKGGNVNLVKH